MHSSDRQSRSTPTIPPVPRPDNEGYTSSPTDAAADVGIGVLIARQPSAGLIPTRATDSTARSTPLWRQRADSPTRPFASQRRASSRGRGDLGGARVPSTEVCFACWMGLWLVSPPATPNRLSLRRSASEFVVEVDRLVELVARFKAAELATEITLEQPGAIAQHDARQERG